MSFQKHGDGQVLPEGDQQQQKTAKKDWTEDDDKALREENAKADS